MSHTSSIISIVIFDFDHSLIDENSDTFVPEKLGNAELMAFIDRSSRNGAQWTCLMDDVARQLHEAGRTRADFEAALRSVPVDAAMPAAARAAAAAGAQVHVVSDANTFYIETVLEHLRLRVDSVVTNPAAFNDSGRLRIRPHTDRPHGCPRCPPNMCKGKIVREIVNAAAPTPQHRPRVFYVGDGGGDVCPCLGLPSGSVAAARAGCALLRALRREEAEALRRPEPPTPGATRIIAWKDGVDVLDELTSWLRT